MQIRATWSSFFGRQKQRIVRITYYVLRIITYYVLRITFSCFFFGNPSLIYVNHQSNMINVKFFLDHDIWWMKVEKLDKLDENG